MAEKFNCMKTRNKKRDMKTSTKTLVDSFSVRMVSKFFFSVIKLSRRLIETTVRYPKGKL